MSGESAVTKRDFFISYNKADSTWAEWIAWTLEAAGFTTMIQAWDIGVGGNFVLEMNKAAEESERTIAVLSPDYLTSQFTPAEWAAAFAQDPTGQKRLLLPVRVRECKVTGLLGQIVYADLVGLAEDIAEKQLVSVAQGLKKGRAKPATKVAFPGAASPSAAPAPAARPAGKPKPTYPAEGQIPIFVLAAEADRKYIEKLYTHLVLPIRNGKLALWDPSKSEIGEDKVGEILAHLDSAAVILAFASPNLLVEHDELLARALKRHENEAGKVRVIPILIRPWANWKEEAPFGHLAVLPRDEVPISKWSDSDEAWANIAAELTTTLLGPPKRRG